MLHPSSTVSTGCLTTRFAILWDHCPQGLTPSYLSAASDPPAIWINLYSLLLLLPLRPCIRREKFSEHFFSFYGLTVWNSLPFLIQSFQVNTQEVSFTIKLFCSLLTSSSSSMHSIYVCHGVKCLLMIVFLCCMVYGCSLSCTVHWACRHRGKHALQILS